MALKTLQSFKRWAALDRAGLAADDELDTYAPTGRDFDLSDSSGWFAAVSFESAGSLSCWLRKGRVPGVIRRSNGFKPHVIGATNGSPAPTCRPCLR